MTENEENELDPKVEMIRRRMMRLMIISILIMLVGLIAVFAGVIYKFNKSNDTESQKETINGSSSVSNTSSEFVSETISVTLPEGARIIKTTMSSPYVLVELVLASADKQLLIVDLRTGKVVSKIEFQ